MYVILCILSEFIRLSYLHKFKKNLDEKARKNNLNPMYLSICLERLQ